MAQVNIKAPIILFHCAAQQRVNGMVDNRNVRWGVGWNQLIIDYRELRRTRKMHDHVLCLQYKERLSLLFFGNTLIFSLIFLI